MKIKEITNESIIFTDGSKIHYDHCQDCCEDNYADFEYLKDSDIVSAKFDKKTMEFEHSDDYGFRFRSIGTQWYFVPCYSEQNGYYTSDVDIYWNGKKVLTIDGELKERF